jgi:uncharacterized protein (DUF427 family)
MPPVTGAPPSLTLEPSPKRFRVYLGGQVVADSVACKMLFETGHQPTLYFPRGDITPGALQASAHRTTCPLKGEASYWTVSAGGTTAVNTAWSYDAPKPAVAGLAGLVAFDWKKMERWMEEDSVLLGHARNPYSRIDTLRSTRLVTVVARGRTLAETRGAVLLYETGHVVRPYIDRADVQMGMLRPSSTTSVCPYKGVAKYFSATIDGQEVKDIAWTYDDPMPEVALIRDRLAFYPERVDRLSIAAR